MKWYYNVVSRIFLLWGNFFVGRCSIFCKKYLSLPLETIFLRHTKWKEQKL